MMLEGFLIEQHVYKILFVSHTEHSVLLLETGRKMLHTELMVPVVEHHGAHK
jgi:hypothetical protein